MRTALINGKAIAVEMRIEAAAEVAERITPVPSGGNFRCRTVKNAVLARQMDHCRDACARTDI